MEAIFFYIITSLIHFLSPIKWLSGIPFLCSTRPARFSVADGFHRIMTGVNPDADATGLRLCSLTIGVGPPD
jgi:hypothetical protein